ncbi:MAG: endonuclease domain-containing protein [Rhodanobacteraceae bacterium]
MRETWRKRTRQHLLKNLRQSRTRALSQNSTDAEQLLWRYLRNRNLGGLKFRRQVPLGSYIADFACMEQHLVVELDGAQNLDCKRDGTRTLALERAGFRVLRFWNHDALLQTEAVLETILHASNPPHPGPLPQAEEGAKA